MNAVSMNLKEKENQVNRFEWIFYPSNLQLSNVQSVRSTRSVQINASAVVPTLNRRPHAKRNVSMDVAVQMARLSTTTTNAFQLVSVHVSSRD